uniref:Uncharacterized protein n=1 Tax=Anguilla anguilla TaxID=7936 RepID=A0A0E9PJV5_ANGAN
MECEWLSVPNLCICEPPEQVERAWRLSISFI